MRRLIIIEDEDEYVSKLTFEFTFKIPTFPSVRALMTIPSADRDLLIFLASSRVWPVAPVFSTFSDPANIENYYQGY